MKHYILDNNVSPSIYDIAVYKPIINALYDEVFYLEEPFSSEEVYVHGEEFGDDFLEKFGAIEVSADWTYRTHSRDRLTGLKDADGKDIIIPKDEEAEALKSYVATRDAESDTVAADPTAAFGTFGA